MPLFLDCFSQRRRHTYAIETDVDADSVQPRRQRRSTAKIAKPAKGPQEHILRQLAGVLVVADETVAEPVDRALVPLDDHIERPWPAAQTGFYERRLVEVVERPGCFVSRG